MPKQSNISLLLCGLPSFHQQHILSAITSPQLQIRVCGFWNTKCIGAPESLRDIPVVTKPFADLLQDKNMDIILLCVPPQTQYGILKSTLPVIERSVDRRHRFPAVILLPPVSPCYNTTSFSDTRNFIGVAMPFRLLPSVHCLYTHLKSSVDSRALHTARNPSSLPSHWSLGAIRSVHARLVATRPIQSGRYSWMCESGSMGGGLMNIYGASLIDTLFIITLGLRIVSVTCLSRTFDTDLSADPKSIRRVSAEDYAVVIMELESRSSSDSRVGSTPVAMLCLSADLSTNVDPTTVPSLPSDSLETKTDSFELRIELTGSSGRFLLPEGGDRVCWTPIRSTKSTQSISCAPAEHHNGLHVDDGDQHHLPPLAEVTEEGQLDEVVVNSVGVNKKHEASSRCSEETFFLPPKCQKGGQFEDRDSDYSSSTAASELKSPSSELFSPIGEAWNHWFAELCKAVTASPQHQAMNSLMATPDHWGYIQRVLMAIDKAARMRCWVDVGTGERL
ncbi:hypothetical protein CRM22_002960 [Opisthorchis felineus]|uniref:Gfo/Idh/MocA-like oxidoreductase N-terminal domain-containing protein n=1 Tax=Opisthorchis felineus TaxID=147828 RepID=A0A4S2M3J3_OPIFE|nr:hypothetical protein CRM22_002960 [Opisthorchis felineus]